jgi:lipoprotein NlpD
MVRRSAHYAVLLCVALAVAACAKPSMRRAPVVERGIEIKKSAAEPARRSVAASRATQTYVVQKGDTMYGIAFLHGVDYREVAEENNIDNPASIQVGQELRIPVPAPVKVVESRPVPRSTTVAGGIKSQPKVGKLPYSETALAQAEKMQQDPKEAAAPVAAKDPDDEEDLEWGMPSSGKVIAEYSESANRKGVDIAGKQGQPVVASAAGKVVYSGSGLRGYGKLVIIKHNKTFLSAYAHNDQILVKEGQSVSKGQKIAEMGNTDADQVKLHFEIRKFGRPVDPAQYLPLIKS